jgi:hypothetical protein
MFLQLIIPLKLRKYIYDPLFDIYFNTSSIYNLFTDPNNLLKKTQLYEVGNGFPINKERVLDVLDKTGSNIYSIITSYSDKIDNIQLLKSDANIFLFPLSLAFSLTNKVKNKHDGIVPVNTMLGCSDIDINQKSLYLDVLPDTEAINKLGNKLVTKGYLIDHLNVVGFGANIYTDKIIWNNIMEILDDKKCEKIE